MSIWDDLGKALEDSLADIDESLGDAAKRQHEDLKKNLAGLGTRGSQQSAREQEIERLISDPKALNRFSPQQLEHQRLTAQSELERIREALKKQEAKTDELKKEEYPVLMDRLKGVFGNAQAEEYREQARKRTLLINLIEAKKNAPKKPAPTPPPAQSPNPTEIRARKKAEILARLESLPAEEQKMVATTDDEEMKRHIQNMYADKRAELLKELSKWI